MAKSKSNGMFDVECPCCKAKLKVDPETQAVITFEEPVRKPAIEDFAEAAKKLKGEAARREEAFQKSFSAHKQQANVLSKKFDELLKKAKEDPAAPPPNRPFDWD